MGRSSLDPSIVGSAMLPESNPGEPTMTILTVGGMTCGHCRRAVTEAIRRLDAGAGVAVDLDAGTVSVESAVPAAQLAEAIRGEGYTVQAG